VSIGRTARLTTLLLVLECSSAAVCAQDVDRGARPPTTRSSLVVLAPLYGAFIGLQVLDVDSTLKATRSGAGREANPALQWAVESPAALVAVKAGTTAAVVVVSEHLRRRHHGKAAIALMIAVDSAYALVVAHSYAIAR
jgi:hypothetical protein